MPASTNIASPIVASSAYFAYGSNMSTARLVERLPRACAIGAARLPGHRFVCNKRGKDESGKANVIEAVQHEVWGVLFTLHPEDWVRLDRFEWGYARKTCRVFHRAESIDAQLYEALAPLAADEEIPPFDWYRDHMLHGAREHRLPDGVIRALASLPVCPTS